MSRGDERGSGLVGSALGATVFIAFLLVATHTLLNLYASTVVSSVAHDTARRIALSGGDEQAVAGAEADARTRLRGFDALTVDATTDDDSADVSISVERVNFLPAGLASRSHLGRMTRHATVHLEKLQ